MKKTEKQVTFIIHAIFILFLAGIFIWFFTAQNLYPGEQNPRDYYVSSLNDNWYHIHSEDNRIPMEVPGQCSIEPGQTAIFERILPDDVSSDYWLCFRTSRQDMNIYIDGVLRDSFSTKETRPFGLASASTYLFVDLHNTDSSKLLTVEAISESTYSGVMRTVLYGDKMGIVLQIFTENAVPLFLTALICLLSIASIVLSFILKYIYKQQISLLYLGWCMLAVSVWIISQSKLRQIFAPNVSVTSAFSQFVLFLIPIPFAFYLNCLQEYRYQKLYLIFEGYALINFVACTLLTICNVKDQADLTISIYFVLAFLLLLVFYTLRADYKKKLYHNYSIVIYGILGILFFGLLQVIQSLNKSSLENGHLLCIGVIFLLVMASIQAVRDVLNSEKEKQQALYASETKAKFLASMSHEIRTPVNAILGMDEMIVRETNEAHIREYAEDIQTACHSLLAIVNDILDYSKIESGRMTIVPLEYDLAAVINESCNMVNMLADKKGLSLHIQCDPELPSRYLGDEIRIRQILINLLTNAIKYTNEGSITLTIASHKTDSDEQILVFSVIDSGIGIKEEALPYLFDSFRRFDDSATHRIEGSGLGLSIVYELVQLMNGTIDVTSTYGKGSAFTVSLPQKVVSHSPIGDFSTAVPRNEPTPTENSFTAPGAKLLIVDDVPVNLKVFCGLLKDTLITVDTASNGRECITKLKSNTYDIIFLDHLMPDLNGIETLHQMQLMDNENIRQTPVIMLTANAFADAGEDYRKIGFADYLSKPIQRDKLIFLLKKYLPEKLLLPKESPVPTAAADNIEAITFLNTEQGLANHLQDSEFYFEILQAYHEDNRYTVLQEYYDEQDWKNYEITVHALSSSSKLIGAEAVSAGAKELELAIKRADMEFVHAHHTETMALYKELQRNLDKLLRK